MLEGAGLVTTIWHLILTKVSKGGTITTSNFRHAETRLSQEGDSPQAMWLEWQNETHTCICAIPESTSFS